MKLEHFITAYTHTHTQKNTKWIKDLNIRLDTTELLEKKIGRTLFDINHRNIFLDPLSRVMKINK